MLVLCNWISRFRRHIFWGCSYRSNIECCYGTQPCICVTCCRCAWLNHSKHPEQFIDMVAEFPRVRAWFSGHFHLSQNYADSIVALGSCAFIQTGVIGPRSSRDGDRQSRMLQLFEEGYKVCVRQTSVVRQQKANRWLWAPQHASFTLACCFVSHVGCLNTQSIHFRSCVTTFSSTQDRQLVPLPEHVQATMHICTGVYSEP